MPLYTVIVKGVAYMGRDKIHIVSARNAQSAKLQVANKLWAGYGEDPELIKKMTASRR